MPVIICLAVSIVQERSRLKTELDALRRRLHQAEKELVESKEQCVHLTNTMQALERDVGSHSLVEARTPYSDKK